MKTQTTLVVGAVCCLLLAGLANPAFGGDKKRQKHLDQWPDVDLSSYSRLFIEDFEVTDPKAHKRKKAMQVQTAGTRMADMVAEMLEPGGTFEQVARGETDSIAPEALILRAEITQYKPGSAGARAMMAGAGSAHLDFTLRLVAAQSGELLLRFPATRTLSWGGIYGATKGIDDIEYNVAQQIVMYLEENAGRGRHASTQTAALVEQGSSPGGTQPAAYTGESETLAEPPEQGVLIGEESGHRPYSRPRVPGVDGLDWYVTGVTAPKRYKAKQVAWLTCEGGSGVSHVNQIPLLDRKGLITTCRQPSWIALTPGIQHWVRIGGEDYPVTFRASQGYESSLVEALGGWPSFEVLLEEGQAAFASKKKRWHLYPGDPRPRSEVAVVACYDLSKVLAVDDSLLFDRKSRPRSCGTDWSLMLPPGSHTLKFRQGDLRGDFEAGHFYRVFVYNKCLQQEVDVDMAAIIPVLDAGYSTGATVGLGLLAVLGSAEVSCAAIEVTGISVRDFENDEAVASLVLADETESEDE